MSAPNGAEQPGVPLQPLPTAYQIAQVDLSDGKRMIMIQIQTPGGVQAHFFDPAAAMKFGAAIAQAGRTASTGLILPPGSLN